MVTNSITYITGIRDKAFGMAGAEAFKIKIITKYSTGGYSPAVWESRAYRDGKLIRLVIGECSNDHAIQAVIDQLPCRVLTEHTEYLSKIRW